VAFFFPVGGGMKGAAQKAAPIMTLLTGRLVRALKLYSFLPKADHFLHRE
jgi:hypothetical protein